MSIQGVRVKFFCWVYILMCFYIEEVYGRRTHHRSSSPSPFGIAFHPFLYVHPPCSLIWLGLVLMWGVFFWSAVAGKMSTVDTLRKDFASPDISNICAVQRGE